MQLELTYHDQHQHIPCGVFLRGSHPADWLKVITSWGITLEQLECYPVPASRQSVEVAGLFVYFTAGELPEAATLLPAYGQRAQQLYLPINSQLNPKVSDEELKALFLYDIQFFHPTIGLIGFSKTDQLDFAQYLQALTKQQVDWSRAHPGLAPKAQLRRISMPKLPPEQVLQELLEEVDKKSLKDIPGSEKEDSETLMDRITLAALRGIDDLSKKLGDALNHLPEGEGGTGVGAGAGNMPSFDLLDRFNKWLTMKREELERKRNKEINRLMDLFEEDPDEALRYALPLDSPYADRGKAAPSDHLSRKSSDFNLGKLGGGESGDAWDLGDHYYKLRRKYLNAAQAMVTQKRYRKAAYIYANLLGDYHAAANILMQGAFFREAAVLYKDHLKDLKKAASCLERGKLYFEAIELYSELGQAEKVGDLYQEVGQAEQARLAYQQSVDQKMELRSHLEAARIYAEKMAEPERAKEVLLEGWQDTNQREHCLIRYFGLMKEEEDKHLALQQVYDTQTPSYRKNSLLNVLIHLCKRRQPEEFKETSRTIAYEIISEQVSNDNQDQLHQLAYFHPKDPLVKSDVSRYKVNRPVKLPKSSPAFRFTSSKSTLLPQDIKWHALVNCFNVFLGLGIQDDHWVIIRGNWEGHLEIIPIKDSPALLPVPLFIQASHLTNKVFFHSKHIKLSEAIKFPVDEHFVNEIIITPTDWLPPHRLGMTIHSWHNLYVLLQHHGCVQLEEYTLDGQLLSTYSSELSINPLFKIVDKNGSVNLVSRNQRFYCIDREHLLRFSKDGFQEKVGLNAVANALYVSEPHTSFRLVVITNQGCLYFRPEINSMVAIGGFFAEDIQVEMVKFINEGLVVAGENVIEIYDISSKSATPVLRDTIETKSTVLSILNTPVRGGFAILTAEGRLSNYVLAAV